MRPPLAATNRASIVLLTGLLAACSYTSPGSQALPGRNVRREPSGRASPRWAEMEEFAYVTNVGSNNVSAYAIDAMSGALKPLAGRAGWGWY